MLIANIFLLILVDTLLVIALVDSIKERLARPILISTAALVASSVFFITLIIFNSSDVSAVLTYIILAFTAAFALLSLAPFFPQSKDTLPNDMAQYDERDNMFSRNNLKHHPDLADYYYTEHPEHKQTDEAIGAKTELGEPGSRFYDAYLTPIANAAFIFLARLRSISDGPKTETSEAADPERAAKIIKRLARQYGAADVGITKLKPHHLYSYHGRHSENYGKEVTTTHTTAIVIIVPMDPAMMRHAPAVPELIETSHAYVESAKIACIIAEYLRQLGCDAHAHTDANYQVLCVPLAVDAGLGQVGRLGLLVHPTYGPCVRISVTTTDLDLPADPPVDHHIEEFCRICKKCANLCPSQSISKEWKTPSRSFEHFSINQQTCYSYWKDVGTDCGFCIRVCPYTKPNTLFHKLVRFYITRNPVNQKIALLMNNIMYGKKIKPPTKNPNWP